MTTKIKIIVGFVLMVVILGVVAVVGYSGLQRASQGFADYEKPANANVMVSDMLRAMNLIVSDVYEYNMTEDPNVITHANAQLDTLSGLLADSRQYLTTDEMNRGIDAVARDIQSLRPLLGTISSNVAKVISIQASRIVPEFATFQDKLIAVGNLTLQEGNYSITEKLLPVTSLLSTTMANVYRFSETRTPEDAAACRDLVDQLGAIVNQMPALATAPAGRALTEDLVKAQADISASLTEMIQLSETIDADIASINSLNEEMRTTLRQVNSLVENSQNAIGEQTLESNQSTQRSMLIISVVGVILGIAVALFIILGLIKVLTEVARFAKATAEGNLDAEIKNKEKGEIGVMVSSMKQIPTVLNEILADYTKLEQDIETGHLQARADSGKYKGGFATMVNGTNNIMGRFLMVIENIPSPVLILDKDLKANYLNATGRAIAGENYQGKTDAVISAREDTDGPHCALRKAMETKKPATAETVARPGGHVLDISYTAIPMLDGKGNITAVLELVTDLSAIKQTERKIMAVAAQAHEIANRVAAASEQLSAQVEQVSRGADMQRSRVESTASAMTEMNSTVMEVARNASQASEQSEMTRNKATDGARLVSQVVVSMDGVSSAAMGLQASMQELGVQAESIGGVMNVITDIADQTNLLALNAAIEAARAGEAGRGFAVVADEVRKLAEKTMTATHEVGSNITAIQESARNNIREMGEAVKGVTSATELANSSGLALEEIVNLASNNSAVVSSIATAAEEQSATSDEISHAVNEINTITNETAEGMLQASAAVQELSSMAQELRRVMEQLS